MYWDIVLKEVLNKKDPSQICNLTNVKEIKTKPRHQTIREPKPISPFIFPKPKAKKYFLGANYPNIYFTEREAETIFYLLQGKTTNEVAVILQLSSRTVEFYLKNMKAKLKCRLKSELLGIVIKSDFSVQYGGGEDQILNRS